MQYIHAERITEEVGMGSDYQVNNREIKIFKKKKKIANRVQKGPQTNAPEIHNKGSPNCGNNSTGSAQQRTMIYTHSRTGKMKAYTKFFKKWRTHSLTLFLEVVAIIICISLRNYLIPITNAKQIQTVQ